MQLGAAGPAISRLGMGCWAIGGHGWGAVNDADSVAAVRYALENGVTFFDTADTYGLGKSETLLTQALGASRSEVVIASKGGVRWNDTGKIWTDISPAYLRVAVENSLRRLQLDCIPLYYIHKPDGITPIQESVAALEQMRKEGKIGSIGIANFTGSELALALQVAPISAIQVRLNLFDQGASELLSLCKKHAVSLVAWGALADGLLTGKFTKDIRFSSDDHRSRMAEFSGERFVKNLKAVGLLDQLAVSRNRQVAQLALRWVLDYSEMTCALFGAKTKQQVVQNLGADGWKLTPDEIETINFVVSATK